MSIPVSESRLKPGRIVVVSLMLFFSVAVPVSIVIWSTSNAMSGKAFGEPANEIAYYPGALKNGEMWHWVVRFSGSGSPRSRLFHLRRLNLETGIEQDTGIVMTWAINPIWIGDELYAHDGRGTLYKQEGKSFVAVAQLPPKTVQFFVRPFLHNGRISTIRRTPEGDTQLVELVNHQWVTEQNVAMPRLPASDDDFDQLGTFGIQFANRQPDREKIVSKDPTNDEPHGEPIRPSFVHGHTQYSKRTTQYVMAFDRDGPIISTETPRRVARQKPDGSWKQLISVDDRQFLWYPLVIADPSEPVTYLFEDGNEFSCSLVRRIEGDTIHPVHLVVRGKVPEYLDRWKRIFLGLATAWLVHLIMLIAAASMLAPTVEGSVFWFGHQQAILAPAWRRALALVVDFAIGLSVPVLIAAWQWALFARDKNSNSEFTLCESLFDCERAISNLAENRLSYGAVIRCAEEFISSSGTILTMMLTSQGPQKSWASVALIFVVSFCLARTYCEGRFGVTPGKWLLGIRTARSTLRPCGFARSLLRSTLYCVDIPLLMTPIPAGVVAARSPLQQRFGDQVADTVVIRTNRSSMSGEHKLGT